ncbi:cobamide remodeling phosphodiesterase CbiR [Maridesulfovibrio sp. FT414]|uniref:cobamide remodeling phosphodiesterase CbiR n=1 Tax=Maridesulfovibrio sp. FT414 TaxID=2979469 RepID=UPI003D8099D3
MKREKMAIYLSHIDSEIPVAGPSWVIPGTVEENCRYLAGKVDEVALLFFEAGSCLNYTVTDLPAALSEIGLCYHIHHPLDLPWSDGRAAADVVCTLAEKAATLAPRRHVIHPPESGPAAVELIHGFADRLKSAGFDTADFLFENIRENDLTGLLGAIRECGFKICLDLGHILAYGQQAILSEDLSGLVKMLHLNAPGKDGMHESLERLDARGVDVLGRLLELLDKEGCITVEVFYEKGFFNSLRFLNEYCGGR